MRELSFFSEETRLEKLSKLGDPLEYLKHIIWEIFRPLLVAALNRTNETKAGRPPYDCVLMFKILVLQRFYNLSDDQAEYQINDRLSFMRFLGLCLDDKVPDAKTIWLFRDQLKDTDAIEKLFALLDQKLRDMNLIANTGRIIDASFVEAPRQRNRREENKTIKEGNIPEEWLKDEPKAKHKLAQKDTDARWAKKGNETHYGYKNTVIVDAESKLITDCVVTAASIHDSQCFEDYNSNDEEMFAFYGDSAWTGKSTECKLPEGTENLVHEKAARGKPLTQEQKERNKEKSRTRCRVEHVFGYMAGAMHGLTVRSIGIKRAKFNIWLTNLIYNVRRFLTLMRNMISVGLVCPLYAKEG